MQSRLSTASILTLALSLASNSLADVLTVGRDPGGNFDYQSIQAAIDAAAEGDEVLVAAGYYFERIDLKGKAIRVHSLEGADQTFLTPNGAAGSIVTCATGETTSTVIEGFTIYGANGAGIAIASSSPVFRSCRINQNYNSGSNGGGVSFTGTGGSPRFENCNFFGNRAIGREGGAVSAMSTDGSMEFVGCVFASNESTGSFGGAVYSNGTALVLADCNLSSNAVTASTGDRQGGAIYSVGPLTASDCLFSGNGVTLGPGGCNTGDKDARGGALSVAGETVLRTCTFDGNKAETPDGAPPNCCGCCGCGANTSRSWGGAIFLFGTAPVEVVACDFNSNVATINGGAHGRECRGGAVVVTGGCDPVFTGCTFTGNGANTTGNGAGGTIWFDTGSFGSLADCVISGSQANTEGGAVFLNGGATPFFYRTTFSNCSTIGANTNGGAVRAQGGANAYFSQCRFSNNSSPNGGAMYTLNSQPFIDQCSFDGNTSTTGNAIRTEGSGISFVPTIQYSRFCGTEPFIVGNWNNPLPTSNSFDADCGDDCNGNGIVDAVDIAFGTETDCDSNQQPDSCQPDCDGDGVIDVCEIAAGALDCDGNGIPDSCQIAKGEADVNNDGILDACAPVDFAGLRTEIVPIIARSLDSSIPIRAICYRLYAEFTASGSGVSMMYGSPAAGPLVMQSGEGFYNAASVGNLSNSVMCDLSGFPVGAAYDSWLTIGEECLTPENTLSEAGIDFTAFSTSGISANNGYVLVQPFAPAGYVGEDNRVLLAQLTTVSGDLPTGLVNLIAWNASGETFGVYGQGWSTPALVDCNGNGVHDAYDIRDGYARDCDESGVPDSCEYAFPDEDCNENGVPDLCDIYSGASPDQNRNNVPDECECEGDVDGNGTVNVDDIVRVILAWGATGSNAADLDGDFVVGISDLILVLNYYGQCQ